MRAITFFQSVAISTRSVPRRVLWIHGGAAGLVVLLVGELLPKDYAGLELWLLPIATTLSLFVVHFRYLSGHFNDSR